MNRHQSKGIRGKIYGNCLIQILVNVDEDNATIVVDELEERWKRWDLAHDS